MRPLISILQSAAGKKKRPGAKRRAPAKSSRTKTTQRKTKPQGFGKWWSGRKRSLKYIRQGLAPYAVVMSVALTLLVIAALWASGVFGQLKEEIDHLARRGLVSSGFAVERVTVEGRQFTDKLDINRALGALRGESLMHFDLSAAQGRIEKLDWVDEVRLVRLWPDALHINLIEHRPTAIWQLQGKLSLINREGQVIARNHLSDFGHLPHVVGPGAAEHAMGLIELLNQYPLINTRVRAAVRVGERRWNLRLDSGVDVQLPDNKEELALKKLLSLEEKHRLLARDIAVIDLRDPERLYVRLSSDQILQFQGEGLET